MALTDGFPRRRSAAYCRGTGWVVFAVNLANGGSAVQGWGPRSPARRLGLTLTRPAFRGRLTAAMNAGRRCGQ